jgi:hypothetical protein
MPQGGGNGQNRKLALAALGVAPGQLHRSTGQQLDKQAKMSAMTEHAQPLAQLVI